MLRNEMATARPEGEDIPPTARIPYASLDPSNMDHAADLPDAEHRLGPLITMVPLEHWLVGRLYALAILLAAAAVLWMAMYLNPAPSGYGTHEQIGLSPCGFMLLTGLPCPSCGMTTAFSLAVRGRIIEALIAQPAGLVGAVGTMITFALSGLTLVTGMRPSVNWYRVSATACVWATVILLLGAWAFKMAWGLAMGTLPVDRLAVWGG